MTTGTAAPSRNASRVSLWLPVGTFVTAIYLVFIGFPLVAMVYRASTAGGFFDNLANPIALKALRLSLMTTTISMSVTLLLGTPLAYLLARRSSPFLRVVDSLVELPIVLPPVVAGVAMLMAFGRRGILGGPLAALGVSLPFTTAAVIFAEVFVAAPFYIRGANLAFRAVSPELEQISQTLGLSPWRTFWRLTFPLARPALLGGLALAWARALSEFGATIMFAGNFIGRTQTMPLAIMSAMEGSLGAALALSVLLLAISVLVLLVLGFGTRQRRIL